MTAAVAMVLIADLVLEGQPAVASSIPLIATFYRFSPAFAQAFMNCFNIVKVKLRIASRRRLRSLRCFGECF